MGGNGFFLTMKLLLKLLLAIAVLVIAGGMVYSAKNRMVALTFGNPNASWFISVRSDDSTDFPRRYTEGGELDRPWQREGSLYSLNLSVGQTYRINSIEDKDGNLGTTFFVRLDEKGKYALVFPEGEESRWDGECRRLVVRDKKAVEKLRRRLAGVNHMTREEIVALATELAASESEPAADTVPFDSEVLVLFTPLPADVAQSELLPFLYVSLK